MMTAPRANRPAVLASALRIFDLSLGQMLWSRRSVFLAVLVGGPVVLAAAIRLATILEHLFVDAGKTSQIGGETLFGMVIWLLYVHVIVPVLGVFYGTALIADEVDDKTITYLFIRPIRRSAVLIGKYLSYLACTILLVLPSVIAVYFLVVPINGGSIGRSFPLLLADLGVLAAGLIAYGAVFALVGARLKRPLVVGLVFAFGWEPGVLLVPGYLKRATVAYYLQGLVPHKMPVDATAISTLTRIFDPFPSITTSLAWLAVMSAIALWWASRTVEAREYVLEQ
jgi:ABC-type transport system involved in multi-copper enzyme maturation permease subunit